MDPRPSRRGSARRAAQRAVSRALALLAVTAGALLAGTGVAAQGEPAPPGRQPFVDVPEGCPIQQLADVVFVGTVRDTDYRTVRFRIDQPRAGDLGRFASEVDGAFLVDVRYGIDTKYLAEGGQFLVGASVPANSTTGHLESKVTERVSPLGGHEVIGADRIDLDCPDVTDPNVTVRTDGTPVDSGMLKPLLDHRQGLLRVALLPFGLILGGILLLAALRWLLTGFGRGVDALSRRGETYPVTRSQVPPARARR